VKYGRAVVSFLAGWLLAGIAGLVILSVFWAPTLLPPIFFGLWILFGLAIYHRERVVQYGRETIHG
jgi:hypothetical protein